MIRRIRGQNSHQLDEFMRALEPYESEHPRAEIEAYLQNSVSIRIRIVDPDFSGLSKIQRHELVWKQFEALPEETLSYLSTLLLLTPDERTTSFASVEFDDPVRSRL
jgi:stress-induced morphogen